MRFFRRELENEPMKSLRKKLKREQWRSLSVRSRYDFDTPLYFLILECFILFPDSFWVHWMIWCGRHKALVCFVMFAFLCACSVRTSHSDVFVSLWKTLDVLISP